MYDNRIVYKTKIGFLKEWAKTNLIWEETNSLELKGDFHHQQTGC